MTDATPSVMPAEMPAAQTKPLAYRVVLALGTPIMVLWARMRVTGVSALPATGPVVLVAVVPSRSPGPTRYPRVYHPRPTGRGLSPGLRVIGLRAG